MPPAGGGYGLEHRELREQWAQRVATGTVRCAKRWCGELIHHNEAWDLGHDDPAQLPQA
jgi:hypothetical protein